MFSGRDTKASHIAPVVVPGHHESRDCVGSHEINEVGAVTDTRTLVVVREWGILGRNIIRYLGRFVD